MGEHLDSLSRTYNGIAHPTRRSILRHLRGKPRRVTEVARYFDSSLNTVSKHIKQLERAGLLDRHVEGREHYLTVNTSRLVRASTWIEDYCAFWERRIDNLESLVRSELARKRP